MNLIEMWNQMGFFAKAIAWVLFIMSMISFGVAVERFYTFPAGQEAVEALRTAGGQVPQGRTPEGSHRAVPEEGIPLQPPRQGRLAGLNEYQYQADAGGAALSREDMMDTVRRSSSARRP